MTTLEEDTLHKIRGRANQLWFDKKTMGGVGDIKLPAEEVISMIDEILRLRKQKDPE